MRCAGRPYGPRLTMPSAWSHSGEATIRGRGGADVPVGPGRARPATARSMISSYESAAPDQVWFCRTYCSRRAAHGLAPRPVLGELAHRPGQPGDARRCPWRCLRTTESG